MQELSIADVRAFRGVARDRKKRKRQCDLASDLHSPGGLGASVSLFNDRFYLLDLFDRGLFA